MLRARKSDRKRLAPPSARQRFRSVQPQGADGQRGGSRPAPSPRREPGFACGGANLRGDAGGRQPTRGAVAQWQRPPKTSGTREKTNPAGGPAHGCLVGRVVIGAGFAPVWSSFAGGRSASAAAAWPHRIARPVATRPIGPARRRAGPWRAARFAQRQQARPRPERHWPAPRPIRQPKSPASIPA